MRPIQNKDPNFLHDSSVEKDFNPYIIGLLLGDGNVNQQPKKHKRIILGLKDKEFMEKLHKVFCPTRKIYVGKPKKETHSPSYVLQNMNRDAIAEMETYGLVPRKSLILQYPEQYHYGNPDTRHFIRGYFDANGCVFKNLVKSFSYKHMSIATGSESFANSLLAILIKNEFSASIVVERRHQAFYIKIYKKAEIIKFRDWIYEDANWFLGRKHSKFFDEIV